MLVKLELTTPSQSDFTYQESRFKNSNQLNR